MKPRHLLSLLVLCVPVTALAAELRGLWEFGNPANLGEATIGKPLAIGGSPIHHASLADDAATILNGAVTTPGTSAGFFTATHDMAANGGGVYVNQYSILVDLFTPAASRGFWRPIFQTNAQPNGNDSDYWIRDSDSHLGVGAIGYSSGPINDAVWTRLVITVDLTKFGGDVETFLDGALAYAHPTDQAVDSRLSLYPIGDLNVIHFFSDDTDVQNPPMNVGLIAIYDGVLSAAEIAQLGGAGDPLQASPAASLVWTGAASAEWSTNPLPGPKNWVLASDHVTPVDFADFDNVTFDAAPSTTGVVISSGDVKPGAIIVENDINAYTFSGVNGILDPANLTKRGPGVLTINTVNLFHGATALDEGKLVLGHALALQNSPVSIASGTALDFGSLTSATIGGLSGDRNLALDNSAAVPAPVALTVNGPGNYSGALSGGGSLTKAGAGTLALGNASTFSGAATITGGRLQINDPGGLGSSPVALNGGALVCSFGDGSSTTFSNNLTLPALGQPVFIMKGNDGANITGPTTVELSGVISGGAPGEVFRFIDTDQTGNHNDVFILSNSANSFRGTVQMWRGTLAITSDAVLGDPDNDLQHYTENVNGAIRFDAPDIILNANREINFPGTVNARPINTQGFDAEIAGPMTGTANLIKQGSGKLTVRGSTLFSGGVEVEQGTLALAGFADVGGAQQVILSSQGTLDVSALGGGFILFPNLRGDGAVVGELTTFGMVAPGAADLTIGTLTTGTITFDFWVSMEYDSDFLANDRIVVNGDLTLTPNAELLLVDLAPFPVALPGGTKLALIEYSGTWNGGTFLFFDGFDLVNLLDGGTVTDGANTFVIDYNDTTDGVRAGKFVTLTVQSGGSAFDGWAAGQGLDGSPGKEAGFGDNPDRGVLANGLEWILGGNALAADDPAILPTLVGNGSAGLTMRFTREEDSIGVATLLVQWNTNLGAIWNEVTVGPSGSGPDANGVVVSIDPGPDPDVVTVTIPAGNAVNGKIFARLQATLP